jgi:antitoxin component YwqK of YwqJK toxin-antitoxin module
MKITKIIVVLFVLFNTNQVFSYVVCNENETKSVDKIIYGKHSAKVYACSDKEDRLQGKSITLVKLKKKLVKVEETVWKDNIPQVSKLWYLNGNLESHIKFSEGVEHGGIQLWHKSGQIKVEGAYNHGKKDGIWKEFYKNGKIINEGAFSNDVADGNWKSYYKNGQQESRFEYSKGFLNGEYQLWYENGQLEIEGVYGANEKKIGIWKKYHKNGEIKEVKEYAE